MNMTIAITSNWQLHIPLATRKIAGLTKPGLVTVTAESGKLTIRPKQSKILSLAGSLHNLYRKKPINIDTIRDKIDYVNI